MPFVTLRSNLDAFVSLTFAGDLSEQTRISEVLTGLVIRCGSTLTDRTTSWTVATRSGCSMPRERGMRSIRRGPAAAPEFSESSTVLRLKTPKTIGDVELALSRCVHCTPHRLSYPEGSKNHGYGQEPSRGATAAPPERPRTLTVRLLLRLFANGRKPIPPIAIWLAPPRPYRSVRCRRRVRRG
jgi:hypothetical protein